MSKHPKLKEFTKEQLIDQLDNGIIDIDFLCGYIAIRDRVYNQFIDKIDELEKENQELKDKLKKRTKA